MSTVLFESRVTPLSLTEFPPRLNFPRAKLKSVLKKKEEKLVTQVWVSEPREQEAYFIYLFFLGELVLPVWQHRGYNFFFLFRRGIDSFLLETDVLT